MTCLVTRKAGSVIVSGPTRTCPCSTNLAAWGGACVRGRQVREKGTYCTDCLGHFAHAHEDGEATATECGDGELVVDVAEFCLRREDADVVELGEELALHLGAKGVLRGEHGEAVCIRAECAAELVVSGWMSGGRCGCRVTDLW